MEKAMKRDKIEVNDRQLACARIDSKEGQQYLKGMACAANFAWVNRSSMTFLTRQAFAKVIGGSFEKKDFCFHTPLFLRFRYSTLTRTIWTCRSSTTCLTT